VWNQLQRLKQIVPEPRKAGDEFDAAIAQYYKAVAEGRGGLFMAVCRGKVCALAGSPCCAGALLWMTVTACFGCAGVSRGSRVLL
jgi:hypothetical protein